MNILENKKGVFGLFRLKKRSKTFLAILNAKELGEKAIPILIENKKEIFTGSIPTKFMSEGKKISLIEKLIREFSNKEAFPSLKENEASIFLQFKDEKLNDLKIEKFIERKIKKGKDYSENFYFNLCPEIFSKEDFKKILEEKKFKEKELKKRDFTKSLLYKPFAELVKTYSTLEEKNFSLSSEEERVKSGIENGIDNFILLQGFPGTGKTTTAHIWAIQLGIPYRESVGMFDNNDQLVGCYSVVAKEGKEEVVFIPGGLLECYEHGGMYILNEANYTRSDVMSVIQGMTDGTRTFHEKNSKKLIKKHDNFLLIFTINPRAKGSFPLNEALVNRFSSVINYGKETPASIYAKLEKNLPNEEKNFLKEISSFPKIVEGWGVEMGSSGYCSIRQLISFAKSLHLYEKITFQDFLEEFKNRVLTPVCSCNTFSLDKIETLIKTNTFVEFLKSIFENYLSLKEENHSEKNQESIENLFDGSSDEIISKGKSVEDEIDTIIKNI